MSERLPAVKPWRVDRVSGSHHILVHVKLGRAVTVPLHNRELKTWTLVSILRVAGMGRDELRELLE